MGDIYRRAQKVIVWILPDRERPADPTFNDIVAAAIEMIESSPAMSEDLDPQAVRAVIIPAICVNSFWSRLWILQEVLLAQRLEIWYASLKVEDTVIDDYLRQDTTAIGNNAEEMVFLYISGNLVWYIVLDWCVQTNISVASIEPKGPRPPSGT